MICKFSKGFEPCTKVLCVSLNWESGGRSCLCSVFMVMIKGSLTGSWGPQLSSSQSTPFPPSVQAKCLAYIAFLAGNVRHSI